MLPESDIGHALPVVLNVERRAPYVAARFDQSSSSVLRHSETAGRSGRSGLPIIRNNALVPRPGSSLIHFPNRRNLGVGRPSICAAALQRICVVQTPAGDLPRVGVSLGFRFTISRPEPYVVAAFLSTLHAYSLMLVSLIPNVSTTDAMFIASPCRYPSINAAKLFCIGSVAPSNCESSAGSGTCSSRNGLPPILSKRATTSSGLSASGPPNSIVLRSAAGCRRATAQISGTSREETQLIGLVPGP